MTTQQEQEIRARAYRIWEGEGRPEGRDKIHWRQAEEEVSGETDGDLEADPGIGYSIGTTGEDIEDIKGENTLEGDVLNDPEPTGAINPNRRGRTNK